VHFLSVIHGVEIALCSLGWSSVPIQCLSGVTQTCRTRSMGKVIHHFSGPHQLALCSCNCGKHVLCFIGGCCLLLLSIQLWDLLP